MLDKRLTFKEHVYYIKCKCVGRIRMLAKLHPIVGKETCLDLYRSLITSLMDYCDEIYDTLSAKDNQDLQRLQKCALKITLQAPKRTTANKIHKEQKLSM